MEPSPSTLDPWLNCEPQLHARLLEPMLELYEFDKGELALRELVAGLDSTVEVLRDPDRWFSAELFQRLIDAMARATGDRDFAYRAGRAMAWMMGPERLLIRGFANPTLAFQNINRVTSRLSKVTGWEVKVHRRGRATAKLLLAEGVVDSIDFCRNRVGVLEAIPVGFGLPPARVHHPVCMHRGADDCVYELHWVERNPWLQRGWLTVGLLGVGAGAAALVYPAWVAPLLGLSAFGAFATGVGSAFSYRQVERDTQKMTSGTVDKLQALLERNDRRILELQAIQTITAAAVKLSDEEELIDTVLRELCRKLQYDRALLLLVDEEGERLGRARATGFGEEGGLLKGLDLSIRPEGDHPALFGHILTQGETVLVTVDDSYLDGLQPENALVLRRMGSRFFVAAPVVAPGEQPVAAASEGGAASEVASPKSTPLGLLIVDRTAEDRPLSFYDRDLVDSVASMLGTAMSNVRKLRQVRRELMINQKLQQYLPGKAAAEILADPTARLRLGGQRRELAIMFTDMAGFTKASESLSPEAVVAGLNEWFKTTDPAIEACNGIVDKRMGDGILVVFLHEDGDPGGRHPVARAASAALLMLAALEAAQHKIKAVAPGFEGIQIRHAIHYGSAIVGNMGSEKRMEYTVIGDAVNICSRLEGITPAGCIWLTGEAVAAVGPGGLEGAALVKTVTLRGRDSPTEVWSVDPETEASPSGTYPKVASEPRDTAALKPDSDES
jgi:class 3 adenylate cyclase